MTPNKAIEAAIDWIAGLYNTARERGVKDIPIYDTILQALRDQPGAGEPTRVNKINSTLCAWGDVPKNK